MDNPSAKAQLSFPAPIGIDLKGNPGIVRFRKPLEVLDWAQDEQTVWIEAFGSDVSQLGQIASQIVNLHISKSKAVMQAASTYSEETSEQDIQKISDSLVEYSSSKAIHSKSTSGKNVLHLLKKAKNNQERKQIVFFLGYLSNHVPDQKQFNRSPKDFSDWVMAIALHGSERNRKPKWANDERQSLIELLISHRYTIHPG